MQGRLGAGLVLACLLALTWTPHAWGAENTVRVDGLVQRPVDLTMNELGQFAAYEGQTAEVLRDGTYRGTFTYRGASLRTLLELARVDKGDAAFKKPVDLAIRVTNRLGQGVVLAWGEVFFRGRGDVIVATAAEPVRPRAQVSAIPPELRGYLPALERRVTLPKLVVVRDYFGDRCLEDVSRIEVIAFGPPALFFKGVTMEAPAMTVSGDVPRPFRVDDLGPWPRRTIPIKVVGEGKGYHGAFDYSGAAVRDLLLAAGARIDMQGVVLCTAKDGYRALLSLGEIFCSAYGDRVLVADQVGGQALADGGRFTLFVAEDLMADRSVKCLTRLEVIRAQ